MFDYELTAEVKSIETVVPKVDGPVSKVCRTVFRRTLDTDIARAIAGKFGVDALKALEDRAITKLVVPIDAVTCKATLKGSAGATLEIAEVSGMKAVCKAKKLQEDKDADPVMVEVEFQFPFSQAAWLFFGEHHSSEVVIKLVRRQLSLPLAGAEAAPTEVTLTHDAKQNGKKTRRKKGDSGNKSSHGDDRAAAAGEIPDDAEEPAAQSQPEREAAMDHDEVWQ
jgi:hypothetical protein